MKKKENSGLQNVGYSCEAMQRIDEALNIDPTLGLETSDALQLANFLRNEAKLYWLYSGNDNPRLAP